MPIFKKKNLPRNFWEKSSNLQTSQILNPDIWTVKKYQIKQKKEGRVKEDGSDVISLVFICLVVVEEPFILWRSSPAQTYVSLGLKRSTELVSCHPLNNDHLLSLT